MTHVTTYKKPTAPLAVTHVNKTELAAQIGVSTRTVSNWMKSGRLPYLKVGRVIRIPVASAFEALGRFTINARSGSGK